MLRCIKQHPPEIVSLFVYLPELHLSRNYVEMRPHIVFGQRLSRFGVLVSLYREDLLIATHGQVKVQHGLAPGSQFGRGDIAALYTGVRLTLDNHFLFPAAQVELVLFLAEVADGQPERLGMGWIRGCKQRVHKLFEICTDSGVARGVFALVFCHRLYARFTGLKASVR